MVIPQSPCLNCNYEKDCDYPCPAGVKHLGRIQAIESKLKRVLAKELRSILGRPWKTCQPEGKVLAAAVMRFLRG